MRHLGEVATVIQAIDRFSERDRQFGSRFLERARFNDFSQEYSFTARVWNFDADMRLARHAIDADRFGLQRQAKIINQAGYARVLHSWVWFEFVGCNYRSGADVFDLAGDVELAALFGEFGCHTQEFVVRLLTTHLRLVQKFHRRQLVIGRGRFSRHSSLAVEWERGIRWCFSLSLYRSLAHHIFDHRRLGSFGLAAG